MRVTICEILKSVLDFLTVRGRINFGIISKVPRDTFLNTEHFKVILQQFMTIKMYHEKI